MTTSKTTSKPNSKGKAKSFDDRLRAASKAAV